ncbi:MAG: hypothetical protein WD904_07480 [Dehalococcoidia bacterium]
MPQFVHVAKILPGQKDAFLKNVKDGFETAAPALKAVGFTRITSFHTPEASPDDGGFLVTIYEATDASVVENFYKNPAVIEGERRNHGTLVTPHDHDHVPHNTPFVDIDLA